VNTTDVITTTEALRQITDLAEKNGTRSNYYHAQALAILRRLWDSGYTAGKEGI